VGIIPAPPVVQLSHQRGHHRVGAISKALRDGLDLPATLLGDGWVASQRLGNGGYGNFGHLGDLPHSNRLDRLHETIFVTLDSLRKAEQFHSDAMAQPQSDAELFELMKTRLYTPVVGDILDRLGLTHQFLPQPIQPMLPGMRLAGRAMPVLMIDVHGPQKQPFGKLTEALDQLKPGEIYLASGGDGRCAYWGEILTATARMRGAAGAVINGYHRDTPRVLEQNWPVFSRGRFAQDSAVRTQVADYRCAMEVGQVWVEPGDLVFGDIDGVVIVPRRREKEVITQALEKASGENKVRKDIEAGKSSTETFQKYGIL
jgi:regulator of RNase E activity RraA